MKLTKLGEVIAQSPPDAFNEPPKEEARPRPVRHLTVEDYEHRIKLYSAILAKWRTCFEAEFGQLTSLLDHGIFNTPLARRTNTDAQLDRYKLVTDRIREYEHKVALNQERIRKLEVA